MGKLWFIISGINSPLERNDSMSYPRAQLSVDCASTTPTQLLWKLSAALFSKSVGILLRGDTTKHIHTDTDARTRSHTHTQTHTRSKDPKQKMRFHEAHLPPIIFSSYLVFLQPPLLFTTFCVSVSLSIPIPMEILTEPKSDTHTSYTHLQDHRDIPLIHTVLPCLPSLLSSHFYKNSRQCIHLTFLDHISISINIPSLQTTTSSADL